MQELQEQNMQRDLKQLIMQKLDEITFVPRKNDQKWTSLTDNESVSQRSYGQTSSDSDESQTLSPEHKDHNADPNMKPHLVKQGLESDEFVVNQKESDELEHSLLPSQHPADDKLTLNKD